MNNSPRHLQSNYLIRLGIFVLLMACTCSAAPEETAAGFRRQMGAFVKPLAAKPLTADPVADLGRILFYEGRLSRSSLSCNDCHELAQYGTNGAQVLKLREEEKRFRDVPSIYNLAGLPLYDWDGGAKTLADKTAQALTSEAESAATDPAAVTAALAAIPGYSPLFRKAFPDAEPAVTFDNVVAALVAFQEGLLTPAPFDRFLTGDDTALTAEQIRGGILFDQNNCSACHTGSTLGGQMLQKLGTVRPWPNQADTGHERISKNPEHKMVFRVAPLRNIAETGPYFHDGSAKRVWQAVRKMAEYEAGRALSLEDVRSIQAFLESLTGDLPEAYIKKPSLPE